MFKSRFQQAGKNRQYMYENWWKEQENIMFADDIDT